MIMITHITIETSCNGCAISEEFKGDHFTAAYEAMHKAGWRHGKYMGEHLCPKCFSKQWRAEHEAQVANLKG